MKVKNTLINFSSSLLYLLPFALATGPFIPDLFISIIALIFIYISVKEKEWFYFKSHFFKIFIFFYFFIILSSVLSEFPIFSLESSIVYFRFIFFGLATWFLINNNENVLKFFYISLFLSLLIVTITGYWQYFNGTNFFGFVSHEGRLSMPLNDNLILGGYLSRILPFYIGLLFFFESQSKKIIIISSALIILITILIYLSGERTAIFNLFLLLFLLIIFINKFLRLKIILFVLIISPLFLITVFNDDIRNRNINFTLKQINTFNGLDNIIFLSHRHSQLVKTSINMFEKNIILGVGPNNFRHLSMDSRYYLDDYSINTHPHNNYFQLLAETGLIGFLTIFSLFIYLLSRVIMNLFNSYFSNAPNYNNYQVCLMICFLITLWPLIPSLNFFNNWINIIYFLPVGFFLASLSREK